MSNWREQQDANDAALAAQHQLELEARRYHEELTNDPGYLNWLESLNGELDYEIPCEAIG